MKLSLAPAALLALSCAGCAASGTTVVGPTKVASNAAVDALQIAEQLELKRLDQLTTQLAVPCGADVACKKAAVEEAFSREAPRIDAINDAVKASGAVASALIDYDACGANGGDVEACRADALARLAPLAPALASLIADVRKLGATP